MSHYKASIVYQPGEYNTADYLSRQLVQELEDSKDNYLGEQLVNTVHLKTTHTAICNDQVKAELEKDLVLTKLINQLQNGTLDWSDPDLVPYKSLRESFSISDCGLIMRRQQLVIPASFVKQIIGLAHEGHQGIGKSKSLLRETVWFPKLNDLVESTIKNCIACQSSRTPLGNHFK